MNPRRRGRARSALAVTLLLGGALRDASGQASSAPTAIAVATAQAPTPTERVTFDEAIRRAVEKNPTVVAAATGILRAEGLIRQARAATRLQIGRASCRERV